MKDCRHLSGRGVASVVQGAPKLASLDVSGSGGVTDLRCVTALKTLHLLAARGCAGLSTFGLHGVIKRCTGLDSLDLAGCRLTNPQLELCMGLPRTAYAPCHLRTLNLSECPDLTPGSLVPTVNLCPGLRRLRLSGCVGGVDDHVLAATAARCSLLQELRIGRCVGVSDAGVAFIGRSCPYLRVADVSHIQGLTDASLSVLGNGCRRLTTLRVAGWCVGDAFAHATSRLLTLLHVAWLCVQFRRQRCAASVCADWTRGQR